MLSPNILTCGTLGEDPFLGATLIQPAIQGIQSQGVIATMKHYINNNQEDNRGNVSANLDERTHMEIYATPFGAGVEAGTLAAMCSYNRINGTHACENAQTLNVELKGVYNFTGWVMSDWGGTHSTVASANNGLDQEMPVAQYFGAALELAITAGEVSENTLDDKVTRILTAMFTIGLFDNPNTGNLTNNVTSEAHNALARTLASQATVLLSNSGILPLNAATVGKVAVIGTAAYSGVITGGGGSGSVVPYYQITPLQGITQRLGLAWPTRSQNCTYEQDVYYVRIDPGFAQDNAYSAEQCSTLCATRYDCNAWTFGEGNCFFGVSPILPVPLKGYVSGICPPLPLPEGILYDTGIDLASAAHVAAQADVVIAVVATYSSEGHDRPNLSFNTQNRGDLSFPYG